MQQFLFDDLIQLITDLWISSLDQGVLFFHSYIYTEDTVLAPLMNAAMECISNSIAPSAYQAILKIKTAEILLQNEGLDSREIQKVCLAKSLLEGFARDYDALVHLARCFCSERTFQKLADTKFAYIRKRKRTLNPG